MPTSLHVLIYPKLLHQATFNGPLLFNKIMDWTGGTRRRYAGKSKGNAVMQKQKAHFAKARAATGYQVIPGIDRLAAASREQHHPQMLLAPRGREHFRGSQSRGTSRGSDAHLSGRRYSPPQDVDRLARKSMRLKLAARRRQDSYTAATDEEAALNATRERLLAREDWLGLAATRPVRLEFPSRRDHEHVGKRRKIDKPRHHKSQRAVVRPFREERIPFEPLMSGAIGHDSIRVKVGTDALLSQTQQSRRSHNSGNTSLRPISTDFGPISEESMLLKADSDGFEAQEEVRNEPFGNVDYEYRGQYRHEPPGQYLPAPGHLQDARSTRPETLTIDRDERLHFHRGTHRSNENEHVATAYMGQPAYAGRERGATEDHYHGIETGPSYSHEDDEYSTVDEAYLRHEAGHQLDIWATEGPLLKPQLAIQEQEAQKRQFPQKIPPSAHPYEIHGHAGEHFPWSGPDHDAGPHRSSDSGTADRERDERAWQGFMNINNVPSNISVAALRSSSLHATQSPASAWTGLRVAQDDADDEMLDDQHGLDDNYQLANTANLHIVEHDATNDASTAISSPSPSHRQILQLVDQAPRVEVGQEEDDQNAIWRQFVLGSQSSQSQSSQVGTRGKWNDDTDELLPAQFSASQPASEQLRSDRMTTGGSMYAADKYTVDDSLDDTSSRSRIQTSLIGHATTVNADMDAVEEAPDLAPRKRRKTTNIHAKVSSNTKTNGRHKPDQPRKYAPVPRAFYRVQTKASKLASPRDIYDLPSSDE